MQSTTIIAFDQRVATTVAPVLLPGIGSRPTGVTRPSQERKLSFSTKGVVAQAPLKEGDAVKTGQVILVQDDVIDKKELERLELNANSNARVEAAEGAYGPSRFSLGGMERWMQHASRQR